LATWADVRRLALALPEAEERSYSGGTPAWRVRDKTFLWERPLRQTDRDELGADAPDGEILGVRVADEGVKRALIADDPAVFFTTKHFDGYAAVLVRLDAIDVGTLEELIVEAWLLRAPKRLARSFTDGR
jgi:hypothetical protein